MTRRGASPRPSSGGAVLGLVGVGRWGSRYLSTLDGLAGVRLAVVASRNPATRERVPEGCEVVSEWRAAVEDRRLDGVILATPPALHAEMARACLAAGRAVMVEKPLTLDGREARAVEATARDSLVVVDHTHVFSDAFEALKERWTLLEPPLRVRSIGGNRGPVRDDVDGLWDYGPHDVALCLDLVGEEPAVVRARARDGVGAPPGATTVEAVLEFAGGVRAELTFGSGLAEKRRLFEVEGANGALVYDDLAPEKLVQVDEGGARRPVALPGVPPLTRAVLAFRDAILAGQRTHPSLRLGVRVVETLERIDAQAKAGRGRGAGAPGATA